MLRTECGGCGFSSLEIFLDFGFTPLADKFPQELRHEDKYRLDVAVCRSCWLVQLMEIVPDSVLWSDYGFYSSASPSSVQYFDDYAKWVFRKFPEQANKNSFAVEIASNDGVLLRHFFKVCRKSLGIDPAEGPSGIARGQRCLDAWIASFSRSTAEKVRAEYGPANLIIANNVAAHVVDLDDFFGGIYDLLADDGVAIIEVQAFEDLWLGNQLDHFYHEHRYYFSSQSLMNALGRNRLVVDSIVRTSAQGGSHRAVVRRSGEPLGFVDDSWLSDPTLYKTMQGRANLLSSRLRMLLDQQNRVAGYGASAKSTTLLNFCGIDFHDLEYVVDMTPAKIGRFTPGTHIPIVAPGTQPEPETYLLLVWNYLSGIMRRERSFLENGGKFLVPIPMPVLL